MGEVHLKTAERTIRPDKAVPLLTGVQEGWIDDDTPSAREELRRAGFVVQSVTAGRTANSRRKTTVDVVCRDARIAGLPWHTLVQLLGLAMARRKLGIAPLSGWRPEPEKHVMYDRARKRFVRMVVHDGVWDEYGRDGLVRTWLLEYSHAEFERARLREKILRFGPNPQLWVTPSAAHGCVIEDLLDELFPDVARRVVIVDWTGG